MLQMLNVDTKKSNDNYINSDGDMGSDEERKGIILPSIKTGVHNHDISDGNIQEYEDPNDPHKPKVYIILISELKFIKNPRIEY